MKRLLRGSLVIAILTIAALVLARLFGLPDIGAWRRTGPALSSSGRRLLAGDITSDLAWRWCGWALWGCLIWVAGSFAFGLARRRRTRFAPGARLAMFVLGVAAPTMVVASDQRIVSAADAECQWTVTPFVTDESPVSDGLVVFGAGSALVGAGLYWRAHARRRRLLQTETASDEPVMREIVDDADALLVARLDLGLRHLVQHGRPPSYLVVTPNRDVIAEFDHAAKPTPVWNLHGSRSLVLPSTTTLSDLDSDGDVALPFLMHVGTTVAGQIWINLGVMGEFVVDERGESSVWSTIVNGVSLSPFTARLGLVSNAEDVAIFGRRVFQTSTAEDSVRTARRLEDALALTVGDIGVDRRDGDLVIRRGQIDTGSIGLAFDDGRWRLVPMGIDIRPVGAGGDEIDRIRRLLGEPQPVIRVESVNSELETQDESWGTDWSFVASVLGSPEVVHVSGRRVDFERAKSEELVVWLSLHPEQRKRSLARTALWNAPIKDATFSNITADARRSLSVVEESSEPWVGITMTDDLPLHPRITSDVAILRDSFEKARRFPEDNGLGRLRYGLEFVRGTPFATSSFVWPDNVGMATDAAVLVVRAALLMAEMCQQCGDVAGVYWATGKGLLAIPGHDELVAIRMRTHAELGDMSAARAEWDSYCRLLAADEWSGSSPSPKLVDLWQRMSGVGVAQ